MLVHSPVGCRHMTVQSLAVAAGSFCSTLGHTFGTESQDGSEEEASWGLLAPAVSHTAARGRTSLLLPAKRTTRIHPHTPEAPCDSDAPTQYCMASGQSAAAVPSNTLLLQRTAPLASSLAPSTVTRPTQRANVSIGVSESKFGGLSRAMSSVWSRAAESSIGGMSAVHRLVQNMWKIQQQRHANACMQNLLKTEAQVSSELYCKVHLAHVRRWCMHIGGCVCADSATVRSASIEPSKSLHGPDHAS